MSRAPADGDRVPGNIADRGKSIGKSPKPAASSHSEDAARNVHSTFPDRIFDASWLSIRAQFAVKRVSRMQDFRGNKEKNIPFLAAKIVAERKS